MILIIFIYLFVNLYLMVIDFIKYFNCDNYELLFHRVDKYFKKNQKNKNNSTLKTVSLKLLWLLFYIILWPYVGCVCVFTGIFIFIDELIG